MKLYIMRHGETMWNLERRLQGCSDIELNDQGVELAKAVGERLAKVHIDRVFCSPLKRAKDTARYVMGERKLPLVVDARIQEISFGVWEGCCIAQDLAEVPMEEFEVFIKAPSRYVPPKGGESIETLYGRTGAFLDELLNCPEFQDESILIVAHGATVRALMFNLLPIEKDEFWRGAVPPNCSLNIIEIENKKVVSLRQDVVCEEL